MVVRTRYPRPTLLAILFTFSASFIVYLFTLSPTIGLEDSGELTAAVASLGIAHPSGYPLYVILGKLFTLLIPLGDIAWRVNLFSAFFASLTVALLTFFLIEILPSLTMRQREARGSRNEKRLGGFAGMVPPKAESEAESRAVSRTPGGTTASFRAVTTSVAFVAASTALAFAFSPVFWSQAVIAEVYALNAFLTILTLWLLWHYWQAQTNPVVEPSVHYGAGAVGTLRHAQGVKYLYWFAFIYGLSLTNHPMIGLLAPVYGIAILYFNTPLTKRNVKILALALALFIAGLSLYLFVYFRAQSDPVINWGRPDTLIRFWYHLTRRTYGDVQLTFWQLIKQLDKLIFVHMFFVDLLRQLTIIGLAFAVVGFVIIWFKLRALSLISLGIFLGNSLSIIFLRRLGYALEAETVYTVYYIPAFLMAFLWFGLGLYWLILKVTALKKSIFRALIAIVLLAFPISFLIMNWRANNRSTFWLTHDWGASLLASLEPDAVLVIYNEEPAADSQIFTLAYLHLIERMRPDVAIVDFGYLSSRWYHPTGYNAQEVNSLPLRLFRAKILNHIWDLAVKLNRPVYTLWPVGTEENGDLAGVSNGLAYRIYPDLEAARRAQPPAAAISLRNTDADGRNIHPYYLDFVSDTRYTRAAYLLTQGHFKASEAALIEAFNLDQTPIGANAHDYMKWRGLWLGEKSQTTNSKSQIIPKSKIPNDQNTF